MGGAFFVLEHVMKPNLSLEQQTDLLRSRGLIVADETECRSFLSTHNYYRLSGWARYFQTAPHEGDDSFRPGTSLDDIRRVYEADETLRARLVAPLARAELVLRTHVARVISDRHGPRGCYLEQSFYTDVGDAEPTVTACLRHVGRSKERHILHFKTDGGSGAPFADLPIWSAVEAFSFGTLSRCIERGAGGTLAAEVASSVGVATAGFAYRVRALVYLRNRCAHHSRLWHHSIIDAGPTPNNVRAKAKRLVGQFGPRSVLDVVASLDDVLVRSGASEATLPDLVLDRTGGEDFWPGIATPRVPIDHRP